MKILLATDGSEHAEAAAKFLARLQLTVDDEIDIIYVISETLPVGDIGIHDIRIKLITQDVAPKILDSMISALGNINAKISTVLEEGYPDTVVVDAAPRLGSDLIVMGARGLTGIRSHVIGSVTRAVAAPNVQAVMG